MIEQFKTIKTFVDDCLRELVSRTSGKISNPVAGSVIRSLMEAVSTIHFFVQTMIKKVYKGLYISKAMGLFLDAIAKNFLVERKRATFATGFVSIVRENDSNKQYLPAGTLLTTEDSTFSYQKRYILQEQLMFPAGVSEMQGVIQAERVGVVGNTLSNTITFIKNDTIGILSVTNDDDITNGVDVEKDEELRSRIFLKILSLLGGNARVVRSAALEVAGVVFTFIVDDRNIPGIAYLFVNNQSGDIDSSIIDQVREKVEEVRSMGIIINIARSPVNNVSLWLKVKLRSTFIDSNVSSDIKVQLENFVNSLKPSQSLHLSDLVGFIEQHPAVDYIVNDTSQGGLQFKINNSSESILDVDAIEMIRTSTDIIEVVIED